MLCLLFVIINAAEILLCSSIDIFKHDFHTDKWLNKCSLAVDQKTHQLCVIICVIGFVVV